jgi:hemin uptake protein HemP
MQACTPTTGQAPHAEAMAFSPSHASLSHPLPSSVLFKGEKSVLIEHNGSFYRLQTTKLGKLILTK